MPLPKNKNDWTKKTNPYEITKKPKVLVSNNNLNNKVNENLEKKIKDSRDINNIDQNINKFTENPQPIPPKKPTSKSFPSTSPPVKPNAHSPFKPKPDLKPAVKNVPIPKYKPKSIPSITVQSDKKTNFKEQITVGNVATTRERFSKNLKMDLSQQKPPIISPKPIIAPRPNTTNLPRKPFKTASPTPPTKPKNPP